MTARQRDGEKERHVKGKEPPVEEYQPAKPSCQVCGGRLMEIRGKLQCERCHVIWETCCEGGRWD